MRSTDPPRDNESKLPDWSRVAPGIYHDFHNSWIMHLKESLNAGRLPDSYYALGEQRAGDFGPDGLTLQSSEGAGNLDPNDHLNLSPWSPDLSKHVAGDVWFQNRCTTLRVVLPRLARLGESCNGQTPCDLLNAGVSVPSDAPPQVSAEQQAADNLRYYAMRQRHITIRHVSNDRIVAMIEIVSPGNRQTLVSYAAGNPIRAFIEPMAIDDPMIDMPLFLTSEHYVPLPLVETHAKAYQGLPSRWRRVLEAVGQDDC